MREVRQRLWLRGVIRALPIVLAFPSLAVALQQPTPETTVSTRMKVSLGPAAVGESASVAAGARYHGDGVTRWFDGDAYRDLWMTPIRVPVLSLQTFVPGGLRVVKEGGGMQTKSLRLEAANGDEWVFRLVDKKPSGLPSEFRGTPVQHVLQDLVSAGARRPRRSRCRSSRRPAFSMRPRC